MTDDNKEDKTLLIGGIPEDLKMEFKVLCTRKELSMSAVLVEFIRKFVDKGEER